MPTLQPNQPLPVSEPDVVRPPTPLEEPQPDKGPDLPQPGPDVVVPPGPEVITPPQPQEIPPGGRLSIDGGPTGRIGGGEAPYFGLGLRRLAPTLLGLRSPEMLLVLFRRRLIGCASFAKSNRDRLSAVLDLLPTRPRTKLALLEFVHDAFDGFLLRLGFTRRHLSSPFDLPRCC
jgi:hypothetical protein